MVVALRPLRVIDRIGEVQNEVSAHNGQLARRRCDGALGWAQQFLMPAGNASDRKPTSVGNSI